MAAHDARTREILDEIERGKGVTQRALSKRLGIALGLTNLLIRRLVSKGCVKVVNIRPNRVKYLITPAGVAEKARATRSYIEHTLRVYTDMRTRFLEQLKEASAGASHNGNGRARIVFYGAGEAAEIAYICLQDTNLELVGVIDDRRIGMFFGIPIHPSAMLADGSLHEVAFDHLIVTSFSETREIRARLAAAGFPTSKVSWLEPGTLQE